MDFLDKLVLPQSAEHIQLINYLMIVIFFLFIPYIGILFVSSILSLVYRRRGLKESNPVYVKYASAIIKIPTINKSVGVILGIVPFLTIAFMISQIMHGTSTFILEFLLAAFLLGTAGVILIYTYRYTLDFEGIDQKFKEKLNDEETDEDIKRTSIGNYNLSNKSGLWGVLSLAAALWLLITATTMAINPSLWTADSIYVLTSWKVMVYFFQFLALSAALTGAALLFAFFYWEGGMKVDRELGVLIQKTGLHLTFWGALALPLLMLFSLFSLNTNFLSGGVFTFSVIALVLLLLTYIFVYGIIKDKNIKLSGPVFFLILFTAFALIIKDQMAMSNATEHNAVVMDAQFQQYLLSIRGDRGTAEVNGKEIFDVRCSSCHRFDQRLVGPSYKDVLPKYEGKADQLVGFILNPDKVNPEFPPMPNPGLKPNEAKAVAEYIMQAYKK